SGGAHPPRSNPPLRSSSAPPSPCITPSRVTCVTVVSFMNAENLTTVSGLAVEPICAVLTRPIRLQCGRGIPREPRRERTPQRRDAIRDGRLRPGERLPPSRQLSRRLSVSRTTVTYAYERLLGEGYVVARVGAGTFVSEHVPRASVRTGRRRTESPLRPRAFW